MTVSGVIPAHNDGDDRSSQTYAEGASLDVFARPPEESVWKRLVRSASGHRVLLLVILLGLVVSAVAVKQGWLMIMLAVAGLAVLVLLLRMRVIRLPSAIKRSPSSDVQPVTRRHAKSGVLAARTHQVSEAYDRRLEFLQRVRVAQAAIPTSPWSLRTWIFHVVKVVQSAFIVLTGRGTSKLYVPLASQSVRRARAKSVVEDTTLTRAKVVSILIDKGGIGKTTLAFLMSNLLKLLRPDLVVVLNDIDNGTLGERIRRTNKLSLIDFFKNLGFIQETTDLVRYCTMTASGLLVLPFAPPDITSNLPKLSREETCGVITTQKRVAGVIVNDLSPNLDERNQGALDATDHLVIVTTPAKDSVKKALYTVRYLIDDGFGDLARSATVVVMRAKPWTRLETIYQQFVEAFGDGVSDMTIARFNFSSRLAAARDLDTSVVGPRTMTVLEELVAQLLDRLADARVSDPASQQTHEQALTLDHAYNQQ